MKNMFNLPVDFKIKSFDSEDEEEDFITIEGYANTTTVDRVGDIILMEAWTKGGMDNYIKNPIILAYHDHQKPVGKMIDYAINNAGLRITANILKDTGVYKLIKNGVLKTFSVGFRTKDADYDTDTDLFVIKDLELMEVSVVSIPANADSTFSVRKSFDDDNEYNLFKSGFTQDTGTVNTENVSDDNSDNIEEIDMGDTLTKAQIEAELRVKIEEENKQKALAAAALEKEVATQVAKGLETAKEATVEVVGSRVEALETDINKKLEESTTSMKEALAAIQTEIKEYAEELQALNNGKMSFRDKGGSKEIFTTKETDDAVLISKILGRDLKDTKFFADLVEKSGQQHIDALTTPDDWETSFTTRLFDDIREKLIVENLFTSLNMPTVNFNLPLNPEAGYGTWVTTAQFNAATSSGTAKLHKPLDTSITAHKLATKELLGYEEEDDSLIALLPLIRDAAVRRMAKSSDKALLRGDSGVAAGTGEGSYPFNGLATLGTDAGDEVVIGGTVASHTAVTASTMQSMRRLMGVHGHNPSDLVYVVNHEVYYDLLEDTDFRTMDLVGDKATILTGQVGYVAGSPVIVSGEFPAAALNAPAAILVNMSNYIKGDYKSLRVERERSVENQTNLLVVTRRMGMVPLFAANPTVVTLSWPAA